eukprot:1665750-Alexandrium_andersonii.AAC.1
MMLKSVPLGFSRCGIRAAMAESPRRRGRSPLHRGSPGPPSVLPLNGRRNMGVSTPTERLGAPLRCALGCC